MLFAWKGFNLDAQLGTELLETWATCRDGAGQPSQGPMRRGQSARLSAGLEANRERGDEAHLPVLDLQM